jgi:hypothetical protein
MVCILHLSRGGATVLKFRHPFTKFPKTFCCHAAISDVSDINVQRGSIQNNHVTIFLCTTEPSDLCILLERFLVDRIVLLPTRYKVFAGPKIRNGRSPVYSFRVIVEHDLKLQSSSQFSICPWTLRLYGIYQVLEIL